MAASPLLLSAAALVAAIAVKPVFLVGVVHPLIFGLVAMVYLFASALVSPVVATLEGAGPVTALRRSWASATVTPSRNVAFTPMKQKSPIFTCPEATT